MDKEFKEEDFTEDELKLLKMAFKLVADVVEIQRQDNYDVYLSNELFSLENKLGVYELVKEVW